MKNLFSTGIVFFVFCFLKISAQSVVVNGYFNAADPKDEWIELLVITDNTDMRNWTIRDNNSSQTSWQTAVTFQNIAFWNNMRAGTVIMIWNRVISTSSVSHATIDVNKGDGYLELSAQDAAYFSGGAFGSSPTWAGNSLNIAGGGEIIEIRNASATHVHGMGHLSTAGSDWTAMPAPKLNHANSANSGDAIYACPGAVIGDYNGPATGNNFTSKNDVSITFGLPNTCGASATGNTNYWLSLRQPAIASQTVTPTVVGGNPGSISFSWASATDPNTADNTTGYIVLKNTVNTFTAPADGTTYTVGGTIGTATVVAQTNNSTTLSYTDNTINSENCYYYRVYAFRYGTDNLNGNSFNAARGRAYNQTNFVTIPCLTIVLPVQLNYLKAFRNKMQVDVQWQTSSELNSKLFVLERSADGVFFETIEYVNANGYSNHTVEYETTDQHPLNITAYYRLKQIDINGDYFYSSLVPVDSFEGIDFSVFPNPSSAGVIQITNYSCAEKIRYEIADPLGNILMKDEAYDNKESIDVSFLEAGMYIIRVYCQNQNAFTKIVIAK